MNRHTRPSQITSLWRLMFYLNWIPLSPGKTPILYKYAGFARQRYMYCTIYFIWFINKCTFKLFKFCALKLFLFNFIWRILLTFVYFICSANSFNCFISISLSKKLSKPRQSIFGVYFLGCRVKWNKLQLIKSKEIPRLPYYNKFKV